MSYKYGLNGNDLNWDAIITGGFGEFCIECSDNLYRIEENVKCALDSDFFTEGQIDTIIDTVREEFYYQNDCDGHTRCYYRADSEYTTEEIIQAGGIEKLAEYGIFHDTNDNFVDAFGEVPDSIFTEKYIAERDGVEAE